MSTALNQLQLEAIGLLASGKAPGFVRDQLALSTSTFEGWRQSDEFTAELGRQRELYNAKATTEQTKAADQTSEAALESEIDRMTR